MLLSRGKSALIGGVLAAFASMTGATEGARSLQLAIWGGGHGAILDHAVLTPFSDLTGVDLQVFPRQNFAARLHAEGPDVVEMELHEAVDACDKAELSLLPGKELNDFVPNALQPCAVGQYVWATVFAYDRSAFRVGNEPSLISDFFNVAHYPGRRALRRSPRVLSEWALLEAGVPAAAIYDTLSQPELAWQLIERALAPVASSIVWVDSDDQAIEMLRNGSVTFAMVGNDALVEAVIAGASSLHPVWDGAVNQMSLWGISANAKNPGLAWEFIRYATSVDATRRFSSLSGYGPARFSALEQLSADYHKYLPSHPNNLRNVVWGNSSWWRNHGKVLDMQFVRWLSARIARTDS